MLSSLYLLLGALATSSLTLAAPAPTLQSRAKALSLASTFIYELDKTNIAVPTVTSKTGVKVTADVYIVDLENHSKADLQRYKSEHVRWTVVAHSS